MSIRDTSLAIWLRLQTWSKRSTNRSIFIAAAIVASMTLFVKGGSLIKDLIVASTFGVSKELDAYLIAYILPSFVINVIAGAFYSSLVPTYIEVREKQSLDVAQALFSIITTRALLILIGCTLVLALVGPPLLPVIASSFDSHTLEMCRLMFFITLPAVVVNGMIVIWGGILNADNQFALTAIVPIAVPFSIVFLLWITRSLGIYTLALGLIIGLCIQLVLLGIRLRSRGLSLRLQLHSPDMSGVSQVMQQFMSAVAGAVFMTSTDLVDQTMAAPLGAGSVSALNFGIKLTALIIGIGSLALGTAVLPYFSKLVAARNWIDLRHTYNTYTRLIIIVGACFVTVTMIFSEPLIRLMYQRGAFTATDSQLVSQIQACYVIQVPFYFLSILTVRLISSIKANQVMFGGTIINFIVNISLNILFINLFGIVGIALSTSGVYMVSFFYLRYRLERHLDRLESQT